MRILHNLILVLTVPLGLLGCGDDATGPEELECGPETSSVTVTVVGGPSPVFNWEPACPVAVVLVEEEEAGDVWGFAVNEALTNLNTLANWDRPEDGNRIQPPVTYGVTPTGFFQFQEAETLEQGITYELILWRVLPEGSDAQCEMRVGNGCLLTVHTFVR